MREFISAASEGIRIFRKNGSMTNAAAISFYAFFSLIPIMFLIIAGAGFVLGARPDLEERIIGMVRESLPYIGGGLVRDLRTLSENWQTFGWLGLLSLISGAELVLNAMVKALTSIFDTEERFGFFRTRLIGLVVIFLAIMSALASISVTALFFFLDRFEIDLFGLGYVYGLLLILVFGYLAPLMLISLVIAVVYRVLAGGNLDLRHAFFGSALFAILWEAAKQLFALYVSNFLSYNKFYGSLGTLMILLLWIFYTMNIFLFAASMARASYLRSKKGHAI
ncbi:MAG TPA: hypothetical protein DDW94_10100 [Deltaproteobacteria bacterium]|nr:MAG: hypothetical protein A2Z79_12695 [Deltaproteobacteria bacterium GWA2_55_82]OGQ63734.1 MAG: hypothetical protein A3I81_12210 [Deltaproteobacteria bacterium RIFCSPLOWO2_02_FULL_55_12]OIJ73457.1 MAG: hypothetical protein A2V21_303765 [Deltaproteobacteria bacterium GWC2_55_46]HBG47323.1 hypothetical protein [Deltaproteobacteria bacterium]HCY10089.1 hypothetical protein [Deltaproteobacteria bacterium]